MKFKLEINCDNAAFEQDAEGEIIRILHVVKARLAMGLPGAIARNEIFPLHDINGNQVGGYVLEGDDEVEEEEFPSENGQFGVGA